MIKILLAFVIITATGSAFTRSVAAVRSSPTAQTAKVKIPKVKASKAKAATSKVAVQPVAVPDVEPISLAVTRVADWVSFSGNNANLPYIIIDKQAASLFLFNARGKSLGRVPVLIGISPGDEATPGVGSKNLAEIGPAEKTTPAGRFLAKFGVAAGKQKVLWVDYATSVALHPIPTTNKKERRRARMLSPTPDDNRITFGCINVPTAFYGKNVRPLFQKKGGYVYVLPDTRPLEEVFPQLHARPLLTATTS